jgi:hypothetical protein
MTRNIVINKNGTGSESISINISRQFYAMMQGLADLDTTKKKNVYEDDEMIADIQEDFKNSKVVQDMTVSSVLNPDSSKSLTINYKFSQLSAIASTFDDKESGTSDNSDIYLKEQDGIMKFHYELTDNPVKQSDDTTNSAFTKKMFEGRTFTMSIEFPYDVITSNANTQDGRKLTWLIPMNELIKPGEERIFEAELKK